MNVTLEVVERFHEKWELEDGCWIWKASTAGKGYGQMKIPNTRQQIYAHRLSYLIHYNELPENMFVCHTCDNPRCVKPSHLFLGKAVDNSLDMVNKDRHLNGEKNAKSKLTEEKVLQIHKLYELGLSQGKLGRIFGVSQGTIHKIVHGQRWKHVYEIFNQDGE